MRYTSNTSTHSVLHAHAAGNAEHEVSADEYVDQLHLLLRQRCSDQRPSGVYNSIRRNKRV